MRSTLLAMLALALSSSIASAQSFVPEAQALTALGTALTQPAPLEKNLIISFDVAELAQSVPMDAAILDEAVDTAGLELPALIEHNFLISFDLAELALPVTMEVASTHDSFDIADLELPSFLEHNLLVSFAPAELALAVTMDSGHRAGALLADVDDLSWLETIDSNLIIAFDFAELVSPVLMDAAELDEALEVDEFALPALIENNLLITFDVAEHVSPVPMEVADFDEGFDVGLRTPVIDYSVEVRAEIRPSSLRPMYAAQIALQAADLLTTFHALNAGHREMNPLFKGGNRAVMVTAKIAAASLDILIAERMWKKNPKGAVLFMIVSNVMLSAVVANNIGVLSAGSR